MPRILMNQESLSGLLATLDEMTYSSLDLLNRTAALVGRLNRRVTRLTENIVGESSPQRTPDDITANIDNELALIANVSEISINLRQLTASTEQQRLLLNGLMTGVRESARRSSNIRTHQTDEELWLCFIEILSDPSLNKRELLKRMKRAVTAKYNGNVRSTEGLDDIQNMLNSVFVRICK